MKKNKKPMSAERGEREERAITRLYNRGFITAAEHFRRIKALKKALNGSDR